MIKGRKRIKYFSDLERIGDLYLDKVYFEFECEPILFVCVPTALGKGVGDPYLCLCSEIRSKQKWIISKCPIEVLVQMETGVLDIRTALLSVNKVLIVETDTFGREESKWVYNYQIDELDLPEKGVFYRKA